MSRLESALEVVENASRRRRATPLLGNYARLFVRRRSCATPRALSDNDLTKVQLIAFFLSAPHHENLFGNARNRR